MNYKKHIRYRQRNTRRVESKLNLILPMHIKKNDTVLAKLEMCLSFHEHSKDFQKRDGHLTLMLLPGSDCPGPHPPAYEQGAGIIHVQLYKLIWTSGWTLLLPFMNLSSVIRLWMCVCVCVRERERERERRRMRRGFWILAECLHVLLLTPAPSDSEDISHKIFISGRKPQCCNCGLLNTNSKY